MTKLINNKYCQICCCSMSFNKPHIYNIRFSLKSLEANCQKPSCKVHAFLKVDNEERKFIQVAEMKKNMATFNTEIDWQLVTIFYDEISGLYGEKLATVNIHYQTLDSANHATKIKVGHLNLDLGKILNSKTYRMSNAYNLEKCYDQAAKLKIAVDFSRIEDAAIEGGGELRANNEYQRIRQSMMFKTSKMRERMIDDEKNLLQEKLFEYEDKIEKYRQSHSEQLRKLTDQLQRKQQAVLSLSKQNSAMISNLQNLQLANERNKNKVASLEQDLSEQKQQNRQLSLTKQCLLREKTNLAEELELVSRKREEREKAKQKKQSYYQQQVEKYNVRYIESENSRNKIIFQLEKKLKEELEKKDQYYKELIEKLEAKMVATNHSSKELLHKKEKEIVILNEKSQAMQKEIKGLGIKIEEMQEEKQSLYSTQAGLDHEINDMRRKMKAFENQHELSIFSNSNYQKQIQSLKHQNKRLCKSNDELKYEIELANKTIQQNDKTIVKMSRQIHMIKQREFYMQQKLQDELQVKTYQEECIRGSNAHYQYELKRYVYQIKFMEDKIEELETNIISLNSEKQMVKEEVRNNNNRIFQYKHQLLKIESERKQEKQRVQELESVIHEKDLMISQMKKKMQQQINQKKSEIHQLIELTSELEQKMRKVTQQSNAGERKLRAKLEREIEEKNTLVSEIERFRAEESYQSESLREKTKREEDQVSALKKERENVRKLEREQIKSKFDLEKLHEDLQYHRKSEAKSKEQLDKIKNEMISLNSEIQRNSRKASKQKDSYVEIIKWILDRTLFKETKQYVQSISGDMEIELVEMINDGLERMYTDWQKINREKEDLQEQNENLMNQITHYKLELEHHLENSKEDNFMSDLVHIKEKFSQTPFKTPVTELISQPGEAARLEELRSINRKLQKQISHANIQNQELQRQLDDEKGNTASLQAQIRLLKEQIQELTTDLSKKTALAKNLKDQFDNRHDDYYQPNRHDDYYQPNRHISSPKDYKVQIEAKYKEQKAIGELEAKVQESEREESLRKAKVQLLQSKLKTVSEQVKSLEGINRKLNEELKAKESAVKNLTKELNELQRVHDKVKKDCEVFNSKVSKKQNQIEDLKVQLEKQRKISEILTRQNEEHETKFIQRQKQLQRDAMSAKRSLIEYKQSSATQRMEKQKLVLEQGSQIGSLKGIIKQNQRRVASLETLLKKSKSEYDELYQRHMNTLTSLNESQEKIKDYQMNSAVLENNFEKQIEDMNNKLQQKNYELQELRFVNESKTLQLERQIEEFRRKNDSH